MSVNQASSAKRKAAPVEFVFDAAAVARAEEALQSLSGHFQGWLEEEVAKVQAARLEGAQTGWHDGSMESLLIAAHDLKGLGATYEYPLATLIAGSLCRLIETPAGRDAARAAPHLIEAHVDAIRAAARDRVKSNQHPVGNALLAALKDSVDALNLSPAA